MSLNIVLLIVVLIMLVAVFFAQLYEIVRFFLLDKRFTELDLKLDTFLERQGTVNEAVLAVAKATKALAASIGSEAIRTMQSVKSDVQQVKTSVEEIKTGPDSSIGRI